MTYRFCPHCGERLPEPPVAQGLPVAPALPIVPGLPVVPQLPSPAWPPPPFPWGGSWCRNDGSLAGPNNPPASQQTITVQ